MLDAITARPSRQAPGSQAGALANAPVSICAVVALRADVGCCFEAPTSGSGPLRARDQLTGVLVLWRAQHSDFGLNSGAAAHGLPNFMTGMPISGAVSTYIWAMSFHACGSNSHGPNPSHALQRSMY